MTRRSTGLDNSSQCACEVAAVEVSDNLLDHIGVVVVDDGGGAERCSSPALRGDAVAMTW